MNTWGFVCVMIVVICMCYYGCHCIACVIIVVMSCVMMGDIECVLILVIAFVIISRHITKCDNDLLYDLYPTIKQINSID